MPAQTDRWMAVIRVIPDGVDKGAIISALEKETEQYRVLHDSELKKMAERQRHIKEHALEAPAYKRVKEAIDELNASLVNLNCILATGLTSQELQGHTDRVLRTKHLRPPSKPDSTPLPLHALGRVRYAEGLSPLDLATKDLHERLQTAFLQQEGEFNQAAPKVVIGAPVKRSSKRLVRALAHIWTSNTGIPAPDRRGLWTKFAEHAWVEISGELAPEDLAKTLRDARTTYLGVAAPEPVPIADPAPGNEKKIDG